MQGQKKVLFPTCPLKYKVIYIPKQNHQNYMAVEATAKAARLEPKSTAEGFTATRKFWKGWENRPHPSHSPSQTLTQQPSPHHTQPRGNPTKR